MAKHIKIGEPVNEAERWAFELLTAELPADYLLLTNLEILAQPLEIDALILGELAIYLVDVKGYVGSLDVDANIWTLDGRRTDNSLAKANYVAKVLAGRISQKSQHDEHSPWCQGMVMVTGHRGESISLRKAYPELCVFDAGNIISALTSVDTVTSKYNFPITERQKRLAIDVIGRIGIRAAQQQRIHDFTKKNRLLQHDGLEIWEAEYKLGDWTADWLLKVVLLSGGDSLYAQSQRVEELKNEFFRLQQLSGVAGVPSCAPLINDGEQVVLPIKRPIGFPLSVMDLSKLSASQSINLLRRAAISLLQIHKRGCTLGAISSNDVFVSTAGDLEFFSAFTVGAPEQDYENFRIIFNQLALECDSSAVARWFNDATNNDLEALRQLLSTALVGDDKINTQPALVEASSIIAGRYRLEALVSENEASQLWQVHHLEGQFNCALTIYFHASEFWDSAKEAYFALMQLYHPSLERIFDIDVLNANDAYYVSRSWVEGAPVTDCIQEAGNEEIVGWLKSLMTALQYLHSKGLHHKNINPGNIICNEAHAVLINFSGIPEAQRIGDDLRFTDPTIADGGWSNDSDLYSLLMSFQFLFSDFDAPSISDTKTREKMRKIFGENTAKIIDNYLVGCDAIPPDTNYLTYFDLEGGKESITVIPSTFMGTWGISKGYMTFLILDMLNDQRPRNRNQWVLHALRSRHIAGNKTNKSSMSATLSRLKAAGIAEDYGQKLRLTQIFIAAWNALA